MNVQEKPCVISTYSEEELEGSDDCFSGSGNLHNSGDGGSYASVNFWDSIDTWGKLAYSSPSHSASPGPSTFSCSL